MDNKSSFNSDIYDDNIRRVIPYYDEIYNQIIDLIQTYFENKPVSLLDTGCGSGIMGIKAYEKLNISEMVLCDPSENMLDTAKAKLKDKQCTFLNIGSEYLDFENQFNVVTAIQSHHYFDRKNRKTAVYNCYRALKPDGIFIYFENTAPFTETGIRIVKKRVENFGISNGRTQKEVTNHSSRYNKEYFPITISEHIELLNKTGFKVSELFWHSYMQSGFYAVK